MRKKTLLKRSVCFMLFVAVAASVITGCGKKEKAKEQSILTQADTEVKKYVYQSEDITPDGIDIASCSPTAMKLVGNKIYAAEAYDGGCKVVSFNTDGSDPNCIDVKASSEDDYFVNFSFFEDGSFYACRETLGQDDDKTTAQSLVKFDNEGNIVNEINCGEVGDDFIITSTVALEGGKLLVSTSRGIETYTEEEGFKPILQAEGTGYILSKGQNDQIYAQYYEDDLTKICKFDVEGGKLSDPFSAFNEQYAYGTSMFNGTGYDLFFSTPESICGYNVESNEIAKIMDFVDSDIDADDGIVDIIALSPEEFIASFPGFDGNTGIFRLKKVPADQVKEKKILTLAGTYIDEDTRKMAVKFNKDNDEYKIKIVDYSVYATEENYQEGQEKFDMDIISGNVPDIMIFGSESQIEKYQGKGLFYDFKPLLEKEPELKDNIIPNVLKGMANGDKLETFYPSFVVGTMITKKSFLEGKDNISFQDVEDLMAKYNCNYDNAFGPITKNTILLQGIAYAGQKYIDIPNKKCTFNSDEFVELLEFANNFPEKAQTSGAWGDELNNYADNKSLFTFESAIGYRSYQQNKQAVFGEDITYVGFPNNDGENYSMMYPMSKYAISAQSKYPEAAWEFFKTFMSDDYQNNVKGSFPITLSGLEAAAKRSMEQPYDMVNGKKVYKDDILMMGENEVKLKPLTQEEADDMTKYILSIDKVYDHNFFIQDVIKEEALEYFKGQKTAKEAADVIQSRLTIYVNEVN